MLSKELMTGLRKSGFQGGITKAVVGAVIIENWPSKTVLLIQRSPNEFLPGLWELPSGHLKKGEELDQALRREVFEETGLIVTDINRYLGSFDYQTKSGARARQFNFLCTVQKIQQIELNPSEHTAYQWVSPDALEKLSPFSDATKQVCLDAFVAMGIIDPEEKDDDDFFENE